MRTSLVIACWIITLSVAFLAGRKLSVQRPEPTDTELASAGAGAATHRTTEPGGTMGAPAKAVESADTAESGDARAVAAMVPVTSVVSSVETNTLLVHVSTRAEAMEVLRIKDPVQRAKALARLLEGLTPQNAADILGVFVANGFKSPREEDEFRMLAEAWAAQDGAAAMNYLTSLEHHQRPDNTMRRSLTEWAIHDVAAAEDWARMQTTNADNRYLIGVVAGAALSDLNKAQQILYSMPYGRTRGEALDYVIAAQMEQGAQSAMNWTATLTDPRLQQGAVRKVASEVIRTDPASAAAYVLNASSEENAADNVAMVAQQWSYKSAQDAVNWALTLPAGSLQDAALAASLPSLAIKNPQAAEQLLTSLPASSATDPAKARLAREYVNTDPVRAVAWANTISDNRTRDHVVQQVMANWQRRDPASAAQFLQQPKTQ